MKIFVVSVILLAAIFSFYRTTKAVEEHQSVKPGEKEPGLSRRSQIIFAVVGFAVPVGLYVLTNWKYTAILAVIVCPIMEAALIALQVQNCQGKHRRAAWNGLAVAYAIPWMTGIAKLMDSSKITIQTPKALAIPVFTVIACIIVGVIRTRTYDAGKNFKEGTARKTAGLTVAIVAAVIAAVALI